jgi:glycolate oxidase
MISDASYKELEDILGPGNVSREPSVLDGYAWQPSFNTDPAIWVHRPVAVALPASTEEVQAAVRACNRHGLKLKAFSTGWGAHGGPTTDDVVQIDLRRMDRILEIDDRNMYAVVEPYVNGAQLQAEAMKLGLNTHIIGAGPACSPLASATACWGVGWDGPSMSYSPRNLMGVEWVLPSGDLLRLGTLGSGHGWFCADGPGPSLRGIMRGYVGAMGGNGVYTRCALKLFHWPGPPRTEGSGKLIDFRAEVPRELKFYMCFFPDEKRFADAGYKVGEAEIGYLVSKSPMPSYFLCLLPHLFKKIRVKPALRAVVRDSLKYLLMVVLAADSPQEMRYQELAVKEIISQCGGLGLELFQSTPSLGSMFWMNFIRVTIIPLIYRVGGQFSTGWPKDETWDVLVEYADRCEATKREWIEAGGILDDMGDCAFTTLYENSHYAHCEEIFTYDPRNQRHLEAIDPLSMDFAITAIEQCMEQGFNFEPRMRKLFNPLLGHYNHWQKKISENLDPAGAADTGFYTGEEDFDLSALDDEKRKRLLRLIEERTWTEPIPPQQA